MKFQKRDYLTKVILIIISSLLYALSFPKLNLWFIAYFAIVPLLIAINKTEIRFAFLSGLIFGAISGVFMFYWVTVAMTVYGDIHWFFSMILLVALGLIVGLVFFAPLTALINLFNKKNIHPLFAIPPLWVTFEYIKTYLFTGFPWNLTGYSQLPFRKIIQVADITGVYGVSFLVVFINAAIYSTIVNYYEKKKVSTYELILTLLLLLTVLFYGTVQEKRWGSLIQQGKVLNFGLIQGNINQDQKWDRAYQDETMRIYTELTQKSFDSGAELVVWPETATPFYFQSSISYREQVLALVRNNKKWLIFGSPAYSYHNKKMHLYNSAYSTSPDGEVTGRYDKMHLVPFGEYVPLKKILFFVDKLVPAAGDFSQGNDFILLKAGEFKAGMSICYEVIFPAQVRRFVKQGADILITITNDAWFGKTSAPYQHFQMAAFRAVENRRPLLRAANTGITGYVDQTGKVIAKTDIFTTEWLNGTVRITQKMSFYSQYGDVFSILMCIWTSGIVLYSYLKH
jgi:apolipoprotein N-acyltransferase